jgi:hypothetical protein
MSLILLLAVQAAGQPVTSHHTQEQHVEAQAQGYAEAQRALSGEQGQAPVQPSPPTAGITSPQAASAAGQLNLTCLGAGTANKATAATARSNGSFSGYAGTTSFGGSTSGSTTVYGTRQQGFGDQVDVRLFGGDDRIRLPRTMLPPLHGGSDGWFKLKNVKADARSIHASAAVNFINNPKVYIDRVTGTISISGKAGDYSGQCQAVDPNAAAKF